MSDTTSAAELHDDLLAPDVIADPYPYFHALRAMDPVQWNPLFDGWLLTRFDDVQAGFKDMRLLSDRVNPFLETHAPAERERLTPTYGLLAKWMVFMDPPDHARLRGLVNRAFTPAVIEGMRPRILEIVDFLLDQVQYQGEMDLIHDFGYPLPVIVVAELLGVPPEDRELIKQWSDDIATVIFGAVKVPDRRERTERSLLAFAEYLRGVIAERQKNPADDLISRLIAARDERQALSEEEVVATCVLLLFAGHETTTNLIGNGTWLLLGRPDQHALLRDNMEGLMQSAVEEFLRMEGPTKGQTRRVGEAFELRGKHLEAGQRVLLVQAGADRDPAQFADPDRLDITRDPNPHVAFGYGIHFCLGAPLARLEGRVAFQRLLERCPNLQLAADTVDWQPTMTSRALAALPVTY